MSFQICFKRYNFFLLFFFSIGVGFAQTDTLFTSTNEKISCKIAEIDPYQIKFYPASETNGPLHVVYKATITKYKLADGTTYLINDQSLYNTNSTKEFLATGHMLKIHPVGYLLNHLSLSYEVVINAKRNFEIELGYINSSLSKHDGVSRLSNSIFLGRTISNTGCYIKPGIKYFTRRSGRAVSQPFFGGYSKLELAFSYLNITNFATVDTTSSFSLQPNGTGTITTNATSMAIGGFYNVGVQGPLSKRLYLDFSVGFGFTKQINKYSNPDYQAELNKNKYRSFNGDATYITNYYGFFRMPHAIGYSFNFALKLGYVLSFNENGKRKKGQKSKNNNGVHYYN